MSRSRLGLALSGGLFVIVGVVALLRPAPAPAVPQAGMLPVLAAESTAPPGPGRPGGVPVSVRWTFDGGIGRPLTDLTGRVLLRPLGSNGGALRLVPQGRGLAVAYPKRCRLQNCPRAILEGPSDDSFNPGTRNLQYGAAVRMTRDDLADGANVVQKGFSVGGGSQYKLQVDHMLGHPSCVLTGRHGRIYRAEPSVDVADGRWHTLTCRRAANHLTMLVDGIERDSRPVPSTLSIANAEPLRIGGKNPHDTNDQFAGEIDNVFITIG